VYKGNYKGRSAAVKKMLVDLMEESDLAIFKKEISIMDMYSHPNIVQFLGASLSPPCICIVTEFCGKGNLSKVGKRKGARDCLRYFVAGVENGARAELEREAEHGDANKLWHELFALSRSSCRASRLGRNLKNQEIRALTIGFVCRSEDSISSVKIAHVLTGYKQTNKQKKSAKLIFGCSR